MNDDSVWMDDHTLHLPKEPYPDISTIVADAIAPYLPDRPGAPPIPCVYHGQIDGVDAWLVIGGEVPGRAGSLDKDVWEVRIKHDYAWAWDGTSDGCTYLVRRRQPQKVSVTVDIPADATDEQIAAAVRAQMGGEGT